MNRRDLLLAILAAAEGRPFSPVQIQKAVFLATRNLPGFVTEGPPFNFQPYDYGPFDSSVYVEGSSLESVGEAVVAQSPWGRWNTYAATDAGIEHGRRILDQLSNEAREYLTSVATWVRNQSFSSLVKSVYEVYPEMRVNSIFRG